MRVWVPQPKPWALTGWQFVAAKAAMYLALGIIFLLPGAGIVGCVWAIIRARQSRRRRSY